MAKYNLSDLEKVAAKYSMTADKVVKSAILEVSTDIIQNTPRDTGRAKNNWFASLGSPETKTTDSTTSNGQERINGAKSVADKSGGDVYYLTNNLPYINRLEYGYSGQAPEGMVRLAIKRLQARFDALIRSAK